MNSKMFLIVGGLILVASLYIFATTLTPIEPKTIRQYSADCIQRQIGQPDPTPTETAAEKATRVSSPSIITRLGGGQVNVSLACGEAAPSQLRKDIAAEEDRKLYNGISMGGAGLGSLMFIYGLSLQRKEQ